MTSNIYSEQSDLTEVIHSNAEVVDKVVAIVCTAMSVMMLVLYIFMRAGTLEFVDKSAGYYMMLDELLLLAAVVVHCTVKKRPLIPRSLCVGSLMFTAMIMSSVLSLSYLIFALPILIVASYYSKRFTVATAVVGALVICAEPFVSSYIGVLDLDYCQLGIFDEDTIIILSTPMEDAINKFLRFILPSLSIYVAMTLLSVWVTTRGLSLIKERTSLAKNQTILEHELMIASDIQLGMLPTDLPDTENYSVKALMRPAKDVGGDFYDFIEIGASQIAFLVADVSGKGVPAALFMVRAMTLIRNNLENGMSVDGALDRTNYELLQTNKEKLFVTVWLGTLDLHTGTLSFANAGHNPPFIIRADGTVDNIVSKPNFVLGRKKGVRYKEHRITLNPGDRVFLYTDGLTDSTDREGKMFTERRIRDILSRSADPTTIIPEMQEAVDSFATGMEQFDDITMMLVHYKSPKDVEHSLLQSFPADNAGHDQALQYIRARLTGSGCSEKVVKDMELSASEIISNIVQYAYIDREGGTIRVSADVVEHKARVMFVDGGPEYNPLERANPDVEKRIKEHKIGGFGIFIVKKLMDDVRYERVDGTNVLTIIKEI